MFFDSGCGFLEFGSTVILWCFFLFITHFFHLFGFHVLLRFHVFLFFFIFEISHNFFTKLFSIQWFSNFRSCTISSLSTFAIGCDFHLSVLTTGFCAFFLFHFFGFDVCFVKLFLRMLSEDLFRSFKGVFQTHLFSP